MTMSDREGDRTPGEGGSADGYAGSTEGTDGPTDEIHRFSPRHDVSLPTAVADAVASVLGVDQMELTSLYESGVDPDALDALFRGGDGQIQFLYAGLSVTVTHEGEVVLSECV